MVLHVFRVEWGKMQKGRRWEAYDEVTGKLVLREKTIPDIMRRANAMPEVSKVVRYRGLTRPSELAATLADLHFRAIELTGTPSKERLEWCGDCGRHGVRTGHQDCQYPQNH